MQEMQKGQPADPRLNPAAADGHQCSFDSSSSLSISVRRHLSFLYRTPFEGKPAVARSATRTANAAHGESMASCDSPVGTVSGRATTDY